MPAKTFDPTEKAGLLALQTIANNELKWICRPQHEADYGVDAALELTTEALKVIGKMIGCQVKTGPSYFAQGNTTVIYYYSDDEEITYWRDHALPIILVLHDPAAKATYWVDTRVAKKTKGGAGEGWRIDVPRAQRLGGRSRAALEKIALSKQRDRLAEGFDPQAAAPRELVQAVTSGTQEQANNAHAPTASVPAKLATATPEELLGNPAIANLTIGQLLSVARAPQVSPWSTKDVDTRGEDAVLHERITGWRDVDRKGAPDLALTELRALLDTVDPAVTPHAWFRIQINIGSALMDLGRIDEAVVAWEAGARIEPENPTSVGYLAMARLAQRDHVEARKLAETALAMPDRPSMAINVLLQALAYDLAWTGEPDDVIPDDLKDTLDAKLGRVEFWRRRDATRWAPETIALARAYPQEETFRTSAAHAVLVMASPFADPTVPLHSTISREEILAAANVLQAKVEQWLRIGYDDDRELAAYANNAAVCFRLAGDYGAARQILGRVLAQKPQLPLYKILGIVEALDGDRQAAEATLAKALDDGEARLFRAELLAKRDPGAALNEVLAVPEDILDPEHLTTRWLLAAGMALRLRDEAVFEQALAGIRLNPARRVVAEVMAIEWSFEGVLVDPEAKARLLALLATLDEITTFTSRYALADALARAGAWFEATECLEGFVDLDAADEPSILYLEALASARRDAKFLATLNAAGEVLRRHPQVLRTAAAHAFNSGDFARAEIEARSLVAVEPGFLGPYLLLWQVLIRRDDPRGVRWILGKDLEGLKAHGVSEELKLARYLFVEGHRERALKLIYALSWRHRDDHQVLTAAVVQILEDGRGKGPEGGIVPAEMTVVGPDAAVTLETDRGETIGFVIEADEALRKLNDKAWPPDNALVVATLGKAKGESIALPNGGRAVVKTILHKYVARVHDLLALLPQRFPDTPGFRSVSIDPTGPDGLAHVLAVAKARNEAAGEAFEDYETGAMTLSMLAMRLGETELDVLSGMNAGRHKLINAIGGVEERIQARRALDRAVEVGAVMDISAFWALWRGGLVDHLLEQMPNLWVTAYTPAVLEARRDELMTSAKDGIRQLGYSDGQPTYTVTSPEVVQATIADLDAAIGWLAKNARVHPVQVPETLPDNVARSIQQLPIFLLDEIFVALETGAILLSDDQRLRLLAHELGVIGGAWTHAAICRAYDDKTLDARFAVEASAKLVLAGHAYVAIDYLQVLEALRLDVEEGGKPGWRYQALALCLGGPNAEPISHLRIIHNVLMVLWRKSRFETVRPLATSILLRRLAVRRPDAPQLFATLARACQGNALLINYMARWVRGHFLASKAAQT